MVTTLEWVERRRGTAILHLGLFHTVRDVITPEGSETGSCDSTPRCSVASPTTGRRDVADCQSAHLKRHDDVIGHRGAGRLLLILLPVTCCRPRPFSCTGRRTCSTTLSLARLINTKLMSGVQNAATLVYHYCNHKQINQSNQSNLNQSISPVFTWPKQHTVTTRSGTIKLENVGET